MKSAQGLDQATIKLQLVRSFERLKAEDKVLFSTLADKGGHVKNARLVRDGKPLNLLDQRRADSFGGRDAQKDNTRYRDKAKELK